MDARIERSRPSRTGGSLLNRIEQHLRLQRELLWHPRLGLAGTHRPAPVRIPAARPTWTRR